MRLLPLALALTLFAAPSALPSPPPQPPERPDILVVMIDDMPQLDDRVWLRLPTIRRTFLRTGTTFSGMHAETPLCCPARAGFLTGLHTTRHLVTINDVRLFDPTVTIATALQAVGYHTFLTGKYLNLYSTIAPAVPPGWAAFRPASPGFYDFDVWRDGDPVGELHGAAPEDYSTDVIASLTVEAIAEAPPDVPLFGWIGVYAPHAPITPALRHWTEPHCERVERWAPPSYNEEDVSDKPAYVQATPLLPAPGYDLRRTCRSLLSVDELVAAVRAELDRQGRLERTLLILTSDNGMNAGAHRRLGKYTPYSTAVPFFVSWPDVLGTEPRTIDEPLVNIDVAPTLCAIAGCTLGPYPDGGPAPDGLSFADVLRDPSASLDRDAVLQSLPVGGRDIPAWFGLLTTDDSPLAEVGCEAAEARGCRWHDVEYATGEREFYDVSNGPCWEWLPGEPGDPCELTNRIDDPLLADVQAALAQRRHELTDGAPTEAP